MITVCFCDFYPGFDPESNFFTDCFEYLFGKVSFTDKVDSADVIIASVFGRNHRTIISAYRNKTILWIGENIRPNSFDPLYSLSCDLYDYNLTNYRLPLWYLEIDWFSKGTGLFTLESIYDRCVMPGTLSAVDIMQKDYCIAIFNNPEGIRMSALNTLNQISPVTCYGKPFGNWFPTYNSYAAKLERMSNFAFNLCPENSLFPGYYTEKALHAKMAGTVPIYMADPYLHIDFRPQSLINLYDFNSTSSLLDYISILYQNKGRLAAIANEPLLNRLPCISPILNWFYRTTLKIVSCE